MYTDLYFTPYMPTLKSLHNHFKQDNVWNRELNNLHYKLNILYQIMMTSYV